MEALIIIAIVIVFVTVVGHLMWLFFAAIGRLLMNSEGPSSDQSLPSGRLLSKDPDQQIQEDLAAAKRLVGYATFKGWLNETQIDSLKNLLAAFTERHQAQNHQAKKIVKPQADFVSATPPVSSSSDPAILSATEVVTEPVEAQRAQLVSNQRSPAQGTQPTPHPLDAVVVDEIETGSSILHKAATVKPAKQLGADLLRTFMEKSNIRWVEIVSAALIVVCSVGLVISLWNTLSATSRFFPSLVFLLAAIAVHGAGQYTLRKWKLRSTSRGILHIGLMLIPLAVLVGILLSRRPDQQPQLDLATMVVLAVGTAIYGALAVTASRALFASRWLPIASAVIIGSLTLVPIHFLASSGRLLQSQAALSLVPLVLVSLLNVLQLSSFASLPVISSGRMRRVSSHVMQVIFAALVPCVFWVMQSRGIGLSKASIAASGMLFAGWASWGWTASLKRLVAGYEADRATITRASSGSGLSWYIVVAWCLAGVCSLALAAIVWQALDDRTLLVASMIGLAAWWYVHGLRCGLLTSLFAASLSIIVAISLWIEGRLPEAQSHLSMSDWLSLPRVGLLSVVSLVVGAAGWILIVQLRRSSAPLSLLSTAGGVKASLPKLATAIIAGAAAALLGAAGLTTLASVTRFSQPAFGGNWAPSMLLGYGSLLLVAGVYLTQSVQSLGGSVAPTTSLRKLYKLLVPLGQIVLLLATFKLCHSAPWAPQWLADLRPMRAWAIGTGGLAVVWAAAAALLRWRSTGISSGNANGNSDEQTGTGTAIVRTTWKHQYAAHWLSVAAIGLAIASSLAFWSNDDKLMLASCAGWILPIVLGMAFTTLRHASLREYTLLAASSWLLSLIVSVGWYSDWWNGLGLAATASVLAVAQMLILVGYTFLIGEPKENDSDWKRSGSRWASDLLLNITWVSTLATAAIPWVIQLNFNLNGNQLTDRFFVSAPLTTGRSLFVLIALSGLGLFTFALRSSTAALQRNWLATLPIAFAALVGCQMAAPFGIPTMLWILASVLLVLEALPLTKSVWGKQLAELNQLSASNQSILELPSYWLHTAKMLSLGVLSFVSSVVLFTFWWRGLPEPLSPLVSNMESWAGWFSNLDRVSLWIGPLTLVLGIRWLYSLYTAAASNQVVTHGYRFGVLVAAVCTFAAAVELKSALLFGAQSLSLVMASIAAKTLGFTTLRNWLGLRQLDRQSTAWQVLSKACRGARWRESHKSAWRLWVGSIAPAVLLCIAAGGLVAVYPQQALAELHVLGGFWAITAVVLSLGMWWILGTDESLPKFGLLAITLGLLSPMLSAGYASWLMNHPDSGFAGAGNYEPYRLQIGLWLASLLIGLTLRVYSTLSSKSMSRAVEACWILLAVLVGVLSILGLSDSDWATAQLGLLAAIIAISCEASGQTWRGYVAAIVSMIAWAPWYANGLRLDGLFFAWQSLLAVVGIASLALAVRFAFQWKKVEVLQSFSWTIDRTVVIGVSIASALLSGIWALSTPWVNPSSQWVLWSVLGLVCLTFILSLARLFQTQSCSRGLGVYLSTIALTLVGVELTCSRLDVARVYNHLAWWSGLLGAMMALAVTVRAIKLQRTPFQNFLQSRNLADPAKLVGTTAWMAVLHTVVALFCLIPSVWLVITMTQEGLRMAAIALPLLGAAAIIPLSFERLRSIQRGSVLLLVSATLVLAWWADLPSAWALREPNDSWLFVQRAFLAFVFLSILYPAVAYFRKESDQWISTLSKGGWICLGLAALVGSGMVAQSAAGHWGDYPAELKSPIKLLTCIGWAAIFGRLIQFAAWPQGWDRNANKTLRTSAVYAAEIAIALGCAATYFQFPDLFNNGQFVNWWPVILFAIAFASTLLGEWLKRIELPILADPIQRSSLLLPLIPLAGVWAVRPEQATVLWNDFDRFAVLLVIGSSLYGLHGWVRGSVALRSLSAGLALLGFWSFLHSHPDMRFFEHPQFWLLPPAIGALIFVEWNRSRLDATVVTAVRYLSILVAYFSSTSEIFFRSFAGNLWPPILLLLLALCGVIAGIVLRVRAFLFCGLVFVMVALFGMVWHAAQAIEQVWPWWAFGIATGVSLIVMLGYFEKNRPKILKYLEDLKQWQT